MRLHIMGFYRFFHSTPIIQNIKQSLLGDLRKKTGHSLSNCRKALQVNNNDLVKAEEWLKEQAKALGWSAAMKLQNRKAVQGLIGLAMENKKLAMVEVNCETDFVSKNENFRSLVESVTKACFNLPLLNQGQDINKIILNGEELGKLEYKGKLLSDELALLIGSIGENITFRRAICFEANREDSNVVATVHPPVDSSPVLLGKYGAYVSFQKSPESQIDENFGYDLCRHIIGMNPIKIGEYNEEEPPNCNTDLIHQEFLLDDSITVGELLQESGVTVTDFKRFECGEPEKRELPTSEGEEQEINRIKTKI